MDLVAAGSLVVSIGTAVGILIDRWFKAKSQAQVDVIVAQAKAQSDTNAAKVGVLETKVQDCEDRHDAATTKHQACEDNYSALKQALNAVEMSLGRKPTQLRRET